MKKPLILFILFLLLISCNVILINKINDFNIYKLPISSNDNINQLKTSGVYTSKNEETFYYFFYKNGLVKYMSRNSMVEFNGVLRLNFEFDLKENWGHYKIENEMITIQRFNRHRQEIYKRWIIEERGKILNDSTIQIEEIQSNWRANQSEEESERSLKTPIILKFNVVDRKPDSTNIWFYNKKWYQENLHKSRK